MTTQLLLRWGSDALSERIPKKPKTPRSSPAQAITTESTPDQIMCMICATVQDRSQVALFTRLVSDQIVAGTHHSALHILMDEPVEVRTPKDVEMLSTRIAQSIASLTVKGDAGLVVTPTSTKWVYRIRCALDLSSVRSRRQKVTDLTKK